MHYNINGSEKLVKTRIITAVIAALLFIPFVWIGGLPFIGLVYVLATIGTYELLRMKEIHIYSFPAVMSLVLLWIVLIPAEYNGMLESIGIIKTELIFLIVLLLLTFTVLSKNKFTFDDVSFLLLATIYIGMGYYYFIETRLIENGLAYVIFALFTIWVTDSGAYFIGRSLGKNKLWPEISPNKTIEGSIGGIVCAIILAIIFELVYPLGNSMILMISSAVVVSVFGQIGDLVESAFKRHFDVKDSGKILPGHGGILDRFDSILFALPILHLLHILF